MISIVRSFGAPVIEPPGNAARMQSIAVGVVAQAAADRRDELVHGGVGLDGHQLRHLDAAQRADAAEVVAQQVDDHQVLGAGLVVGAQRGGAVGVLDRVRGTRAAVPLIGLRLDDPLAVDAQEALGRGAEHRDVAEAQQRRVRRGVARPQGAIGGERDRSRRRCAARWSGRPRRSRPRRSRAGRRRCWPGRRRAPSRAVKRQRAGRGGAGGAGAASARRAGARSSPATPRRRRRRSASAEREQVDAALVVVEGDQPVAEHERGVGQRRAVHERAAALGLELVAEVAGEAARRSRTAAPGRRPADASSSRVQ